MQVAKTFYRPLLLPLFGSDFISFALATLTLSRPVMLSHSPLFMGKKMVAFFQCYHVLITLFCIIEYVNLHSHTTRTRIQCERKMTAYQQVSKEKVSLSLYASVCIIFMYI